MWLFTRVCNLNPRLGHGSPFMYSLPAVWAPQQLSGPELVSGSVIAVDHSFLS